MTLGLYVLITALLPVALEALMKHPPGISHRLHPAFWLATPVIGALWGLGALLHVPSPLIALLIHATAFTMLVVMSNKKVEILRMVCASQDSENFRHMLFYPGFYLVHLGWGRVIFGAAALTALLGLLAWIDTPVLLLDISGWPALLSWLVGVLLWWAAYFALTRGLKSLVHERATERLGLTRDPDIDAGRFGYFLTILLHAVLILDRRHIEPLATSYRKHITPPEKKILPHILLLQGESYIDLARVDSLVGRPGPWPALEALRRRGAATGPFDVPCWGAYTMQTEMAVLTGIPRGAYLTARINPYQVLASKRRVWSIAHALGDLGYETRCLHPAKAGFFRRNQAMPRLGFEVFETARHFQGAETYGPYISDAALSDRVEALLAASDRPMFLHVISMESHGPWEAGRLAGVADEAALVAREPTGDASYALYRQHMENLIAMTERLLCAPAGSRPRVLGLYGDHQPAHGPLFDRLNFSDQRVDWLLARSDGAADCDGGERRAEDFGLDLLRLVGFDIRD